MKKSKKLQSWGGSNAAGESGGEVKVSAFWELLGRRGVLGGKKASQYANSPSSSETFYQNRERRKKKILRAKEHNH